VLNAEDGFIPCDRDSDEQLWEPAACDWMERLPALGAVPVGHYVYSALFNPFVLVGTVLSAAYMLAQLSLFSWADLSFVVPVIASSYVVTTLLSQFVSGETVLAERWFGVVLITLGVALVSRTKLKTAGEDRALCHTLLDG